MSANNGEHPLFTATDATCGDTLLYFFKTKEVVDDAADADATTVEASM